MRIRGIWLTGAVLALAALSGCQDDAALAPEPVGQARIALERKTCESLGGNLVSSASGAVLFCQKPTRDSAKACASARDCEGACLARSRSCAPVMPMLGCTEVLSEAGFVVTECVQ
jgi:hypothetical protein